MASEDTGDLGGLAVSEDVRRWLQRTADEHGVDVEHFVRELLAAHHALDSDGTNLDAVEESIDRGELDSVREEFTELLEDVRSRVIQVKRETDAKAPADHDHESIESDLEALQSAIDDLDGDLEAHQERVESLGSAIDDGFENFEEVLEYLLETTDDLAERTDRLARATIGTRERVQEFAGTIEERAAADRLKRDAALEGIGSADCAECGQSVRAALLTAPECPFCAAEFVDLEPKRGLFGSATFQTGARPALTGADEDPVADELRSDVERDRPDPADVDWDAAGDDGP
ncbi:hypothetical protein L593_14260 [Salinarchaeum sp. Harcht-Bsk1]|uniref:hypothetical protein n=1 Tax=Salinarchaeum sp. Harcht-Bsk1 TaxID=1333523 RepID=UPI00034248F6|nr:hypothetical protein [Salinarchaeum sp. Harcht-Bsk1]AGN02791.1 hypothetical protein L593_14260 [Salinarchaeum sp. Harcht-Bsk1]